MRRYVCIFASGFSKPAFACMHASTCMHAYIFTCVSDHGFVLHAMYIRVAIPVYVCMYQYVCSKGFYVRNMCVYVYACMCVCVCVNLQGCIGILRGIHIHAREERQTCACARAHVCVCCPSGDMSMYEVMHGMYLLSGAKCCANA
jgi:hypothetical protein